MLAVVTKRFGTCSVNVRAFPRGGTWRCDVEQLRPRYVDQEDTDQGPVQIQTMEPVVSLQEATLLADGAPTPALAQMPVLVPPPVRKAQNPCLPTAPTILGGHPGDPFQGSQRFAPEEEHQG